MRFACWCEHNFETLHLATAAAGWIFSFGRKNRERGKGRLANGEPVSFGFELGHFDSKKMYCIHELYIAEKHNIATRVDTMVTKLQD